MYDLPLDVEYKEVGVVHTSCLSVVVRVLLEGIYVTSTEKPLAMNYSEYILQQRTKSFIVL